MEAGLYQKDMLLDFYQEARKHDIVVSINATELKEQMIHAPFEKILGIALGVAKRNCIKTSLPRERLILIDSRTLQRRIFLKIRYSCNDGYFTTMEKDVVEMKDLVEERKGYFNMQFIKDAVDIKISLPLH